MEIDPKSKADALAEIVWNWAHVVNPDFSMSQCIIYAYLHKFITLEEKMLIKGYY